MSELQYALDRMSTPLDPSRLSGATADEDARCMGIIRAEIERLQRIVDEDGRASEREAKLRAEVLARTRERDEVRAERYALRDVLLRHGFVPCDIPACNCGSWHPRFGYPERMQEIKDALAEAGHPLSNENGHMPLRAIGELVAEVEALRNLLHRAGNELVCGGEVMSESDDEWTRSHACGRCDDYVDRGWPIRTEIRAALAQAKSLMQEQPK